MTDGCYDENGKCVNCGKFHPCDCEIIVIEANTDLFKPAIVQEINEKGWLK